MTVATRIQQLLIERKTSIECKTDETSKYKLPEFPPKLSVSSKRILHF